MDSGKDIQHYYHANASAWGGQLNFPIDVTLPVLAPTSLPSVGGYLQAQHEGFRVDGLISIERAYTSVSGARSPEDGSYHTRVIAAIEGVNIANVLFADRIAMDLSTNHPPDNYFPTVSFNGTDFVGLRANKCELTPQLDLSAFRTDGYPKESWLYNPRLREFARNQSRELAAGAANVAGKNIPFFNRLFDRHSRSWTNGEQGPNSEQAIADRGNIICTVIKTIQVAGVCTDTTVVGNTLHVPDFGRIILGELIVDGSSFNLTMMRLDMGSGATGKGSGPQGGANGTNTGGV
jgi:hypothetical protein